MMINQEFFEKLTLLLRSECNLEKDLLAFVNKNDSYNSGYKCKFADLLTVHGKELQTEVTKFQKDLQHVNDSISIFRHELVQPKPDKIDYIKKVMESIESQISMIKNYQKSIYDTLLVSESALTAELALFDKELSKYERPITLPQKFSSSKVRSQISKQHDLHPAIVEFDKFHSSHGPTNGWGEFEHQMFIKAYNSLPSDDEIVKNLSPSLPFKSNEQILEQITWFKRYCTLEKAKRDALKEWRDTKEARIAKSKQKLNNKISLEGINSKKQKLYEKERQERLANLNAYKVQKELQRVLEEEKALKLRLEADDREAKRQEYALKQKAKVAAYKERMKIEKEMKLAEEQDLMMSQRSHSTASSSDLMRLHKKNMELVEKKQHAKQEKIIAEFEQQQRLEKMKPKIKVERDPSRLLKKTQGQIHREKDKSASNNPIVGSRGMPHKAMPAWRKGL